MDIKAPIYQSRPSSWGELMILCSSYLAGVPSFDLLQNILYFGYRTLIGVGTKPAQLMRAFINLEWADTIIPSIRCTNCAHHLKYNSSRSATYEANGTELDFGRWGKGRVSRDTITLGDGVHISHHPFLEADRIEASFLFFNDDDTFLGLAIAGTSPQYQAPHYLPSPMSTLIREGSLDRNIVSMLLPRDDDDLGDLMFGAVDEALYSGDLSTHPLYPPDTTQWQIELNSAHISNSGGAVIHNESFPGYTARLHTAYPFIILPPTLGETIVNATGADCSDGCKGCVVPCNELHKLPHLTFNLGGHNVTITGEDYAVKTDIRWPFCKYSVRCELVIGPGSKDYLEPKTIELGSAFLRGLYSVFDYDARSIHCKSFPRG